MVMKNTKSLQVLALAGVAVALTTGCSSTGMSSANTGTDGEYAAYRVAGGSGFQPITDIRQMGRFPVQWNPVSAGEQYVFQVPAKSTTVASTSDLPAYSDSLQPGDAFVEAAGSSNEGEVKRVILYTPFAGR